MKKRIEDIDNKNLMQVPDGYFKELPLKIQTRINNEKSNRSAIPTWSRISLAGLSLVIVVFTFIFFPTEDSPELLLAQVDHDELVNYLETLELEDYEIANAFSDVEGFLMEDENMLPDVNIEDEALDNVLLEYDLEDEYL